MPVMGILPSLWQLSRSPQPGALARKRRRLSQQFLQLTLVWLLFYALLWGGGELVSDLSSFRLMYLNGLITSGYFLACLGWMGWTFFQPHSPAEEV